MIIKYTTVFAMTVLSALFWLQGCQKSNQFTLLTGESKSLEDYQGQWVVVNFWAEWCPPCLKEIPELNALDQSSKDIQVLGVSFDKLSNDELKELMTILDIQYPVLATEPIPFLPMAKPQSLPATYIVTPTGEVLGPLMGEVSKQKLLDIIEKIKQTSGYSS